MNAAYVEVCEARALLAAAITSSSSIEINDSETDLASAAAYESKVSKFITFNRWTTTATNGSGLQQGDPTTLTWSFPADGTVTDNAEENPDAPNVLRAFLDTNFGSGPGGSDLTQRPWFSIFDNSVGRLQALSGLTFTYITQDDGAAMRSGNIGIAGQRADIRIMGKSVDGQSGFNTLAYNYFPNFGDMIVDTDNIAYFTQSSNSFRPFRNTIMHEFMHGIGIDHVESSDSVFLIEPADDDSIDGPQLDDILAIQRLYGDPLEKSGGNTSATALDLGTIASSGTVSRGTLGDTVVVNPAQTDFVSIDDEGDQDFYKFTVDAVGSVTITLSPRGASYMVGPENGTQALFNSKNQGDLTLKLLGEDGVTVLETRNVGGLGANESIQDFSLNSPGTYFVQVTSSTVNKIQLYGLDVNFNQPAGGQIMGRVYNDADGDGTQDAGELGLENIRVYIDDNSNGSFDVGEVSVTTESNGDYAITGLLGTGLVNVRAELATNRQITDPSLGFHEVDLAFEEVVTDVNFGSRLLPIGTSGNDAFVLSYSDTAVTITMSTNGGSSTLIGTFPTTSPLSVDGVGGTDSVRIVGTSGADEFFPIGASDIEVNEHPVMLTSIEQRTLVGGTGDDEYVFDADTQLGTWTLEEAVSGGTDLLDFFLSSTAVNIDLAQSTSQVVNSNLNLVLGASNTFENVEGGAGADKLFGNSLNNILSGNGEADDLEGRAGNDTLKGGNLSDLYLFDADSQLGEDTIVELVGQGFDLVDFRPTSANIQIDLGTIQKQTVNSNLKLTLSAINVIDDVRSGSGNDKITGNALANFLFGGDGNDELRGLSENDELDGQAGDDRYIFDVDIQLGADKIAELSNGGTDELIFTDSASAVVVNMSQTTQQTVNSNLKLTLSAGNVLENVRGGSGNDTLTGNSLVNRILGQSGNDSLFGGGEGDTLFGEGGDDTLHGQDGNDTLVGGTDNDAYIFVNATSAESDTVIEKINEGRDFLDFVNVTSNLNLSLSQGTSQPVHSLRTLILNGASAIENARGGSGNDTLTGNALNNDLQGRQGNDTLNGAGGNDSLSGDIGDDIYNFLSATALEEDNVLELAGAGTDTLSFSQLTTPVTISLLVTGFQTAHINRELSFGLSAGAIENLIGGLGNDTLTGNNLNNVLNGSSGNDVLRGVDGNDSMIGGPGNDTYRFDSTTSTQTDTITESSNAGNDTIDMSTVTTDSMLNLSVAAAQAVHTNRSLVLQGASHLENVIGGDGNDVFIGNGLANRLTGNKGRDILVGEAGGDFLFGGNGDDILIGGRVNVQQSSSNPITFTEFYTKLRSTWITERTYNERVADVKFPQSIGTGKFVYLARASFNILGIPVSRTVFDDGIKDELLGEVGIDLFFSGPLDLNSDRATSETLEAITP